MASALPRTRLCLGRLRGGAQVRPPGGAVSSAPTPYPGPAPEPTASGVAYLNSPHLQKAPSCPALQPGPAGNQIKPMSPCLPSLANPSVLPPLHWALDLESKMEERERPTWGLPGSGATLLWLPNEPQQSPRSSHLQNGHSTLPPPLTWRKTLRDPPPTVKPQSGPRGAQRRLWPFRHCRYLG